jgi:hypothetical protein
MKLFARILAAAILFVGFSACDDNNDSNGPATRTFTATLTGANEVPPNASDATATATLVLNEDTNEFDLTVPYSGITATAAHIHKGAVGVAGPAVFPITDLTSPLTLTDVAISATEEADLKNGLYYVNIHSADHPEGEIRGQLTED